MVLSAKHLEGRCCGPSGQMSCLNTRRSLLGRLSTGALGCIVGRGVCYETSSIDRLPNDAGRNKHTSFVLTIAVLNLASCLSLILRNSFYDCTGN